MSDVTVFMQNTYSPKQSTVYLWISNALLTLWAWNPTSAQTGDGTPYHHLEQSSALHSNKVWLDLHSNGEVGLGNLLAMNKEQDQN
jgi:hypothetical protein